MERARCAPGLIAKLAGVSYPAHMLELTRFTTSFSETEDRIQLSGISEEGETWTLWLTQRLLNRLIPVLCKQIGPNGPDERATLINSFEQMAAVQNIKPLPPVEQAPTAAVFTVQAIRIESGAGAVKVIFKERDDGDGRLAALTLREEPLRQWLAILHRHYANAGWNMAPWPVWLVSDPPSQEAKASLMN